MTLTPLERFILASRSDTDQLHARHEALPMELMQEVAVEHFLEKALAFEVDYTSVEFKAGVATTIQYMEFLCDAPVPESYTGPVLRLARMLRALLSGYDELIKTRQKKPPPPPPPRPA